LSELASAQNARDRNGTALNFFSPVRLIVACAVTLALIVVGGAGFIAYNLAHWQRTRLRCRYTVLILVVRRVRPVVHPPVPQSPGLEQAREDRNRASSCGAKACVSNGPQQYVAWPVMFDEHHGSSSSTLFGDVRLA
jgi:hypothetical protein